LQAVRPSKTVHCRLCNRCYLLRDHHCVYLYRCIAANNRALFFSFAVVSVVGMLTFESMSVWYFVERRRGSLFHLKLFVDIFYDHPFVWPLFLLNGIALGWLIFVFGEAFVSYARFLLRCAGARSLSATKRFL
jgi:hypothetical protein